MRVYRRRRVFKIIIFLAVIGLIFLGFQVLSVQVLNLEAGKSLAGFGDTHIKVKDTERNTDAIKTNTDAVKPREHPFKFKERIAKVKHNLHKNPDPSRSLTKEERNAQKNAIAKVIADLQKGDQTKKISLQEIAAEREHRAEEEDAQRARVDAEVRHIRRQVVNASSGSPRGVSLERVKYYKPDAKGMFRCIDSGELVLFARVNDDYCDCMDGTDEPGTSACNNGRFYCHFQLDLHHLVWFPSSKVNDAICDCCDASDEWDAPELPPHVALHDGKPAYGVYQWPCQDQCHTLVEARMSHLDVNRRGAAVRRQYIAEFKGKKNPDNVYGKQGEFFPLSTSCFHANSGKYGYEVCPFQEVRQRFQGTARIIGKNHAVWVKQDPATGFRLKMTNGDGMQCPMMKARLTWMDFTCGVDNKILSVQETEVCEYTVQFETPAACSDVSEQGNLW